MPEPIYVVEHFAELVLLAFAAYRITRFFVLDSLMGFNVESGSKTSQRLDRFAYAADGKDRSWVRGKIGDLLVCTYCLGFHVSWLLLCAWFRVWPWDLGVAGWIAAFAVTGGQALLNALDRKWER